MPRLRELDAGPIIRTTSDATPEEVAELERLQREVQELREYEARRIALDYYNNPALWARDNIKWPAGSRSLTPYQEEILMKVPEVRRVSVRSPHGVGKDLDVTTPLPTPTGWTTVGEVQAGDWLLDEEGRPTEVLYAEEPKWRDAYRVRFSTGAEIVAGAGHLWTAIDVYVRPKGVSDWRDHWDSHCARTKETSELAATVRSPGGQARWRVPTTRPLDLPAADLPIPPYLLGYWLGDGASANGSITIGHTDADETIPRLGDGSTRPTGTACVKHTPRGLMVALRGLGLLGNKHIPMSYLRASVEQRRELARGLWDSDGYRCRGDDEITLTNKQLAQDVAALLRTLGLSVRVSESDATLRGRVIGRRWRIRARFDFNPYKLSRYKWEQRGAQASRHTQRTIVSIDPVGKRLTKCIAVSSPRGLFLAGDDMIPTHNTTMAALLCLWFVTTREQMGVDWKVVTTASNWNQLTHYLWPEIQKWARLLDFEKLKLHRWERGRHLFAMNIKGLYGEAFGMSPADPQGLEGAHATELLYVFDESKAIPDPIFDAAEGAFSTAGVGTGTNAFAFAISTPGEPAGRFYSIHARLPGTQDWWARHVTLQEAIAAGQITQEWVDQRRLMWGETSAVYQNRVLGEFAADAADSVVPLAWIELANDRWRAQYELPDGTIKGYARTPHHGTPAVLREGEKIHVIGVDVAGSGEDRSVVALRKGNTIAELRRYQYTDNTMEVVAIVEGIQENHQAPKAIVDANGIGAGVADRLRELKLPVQAFIAQAGIHRRDASGDYGMANVRSWAYWNLREMLTPHSGCNVALPPDDRLTGDLTSIKWSVAAGARIAVERKEDIRKRISRSCDDADAVAMAFFTHGGSWANIYLPPSEELTPDKPTGVTRRAGSFAELFLPPEKRRVVKKPVLTVLMGVPGSGKSTFAASANQQVLSTDETLGLEDHEKPEVMKRLHREAQDLLATGQDVIVDGCNVSPALRAQWRNVAKAAGAVSRLVVLHCEDQEAQANQQARGRLVPEDKMARYWEQFRESLTAIDDEDWGSVEHAFPFAPDRSGNIVDELPPPREQRGWYGSRRGSWFS